MNYRYQIREIRGEFYIFCQYDYVSGMWWWKKKKTSEWQRPQIWIDIRPMPPFKTLEAAQNKVEMFKRKTVIHECI